MARWLLLAMLWQALVGVAMHQRAHGAGEGRSAPATGTAQAPVAGSETLERSGAEAGEPGRMAAVSPTEDMPPDEDHAAEPCAWCLAQADLAHPVGSAPHAVSVASAVAVPGAVMPLPSTAPWWATPARGPPVA